MKTEKIHNLTLHHVDCMAFMATLPDKAFDLAIVDPPYGIGFSKKHTGNGWVVRETKSWDKEPPTAEYFKELFRISKNQIIWGANYMTPNLPPSQHWIFWDKGQRNFSLADGELAYSSFDMALRVFEMSRGAMQGEQGGEIKFHPTQQKPIKLYEWLLTNYAKPGQKILDTHLGSGSHAIAAHNLGFEFVGCELDEDYFNASIKRIKMATSQISLLDSYTQVERDDFEQRDLL
jgi:site-specific DNA-methyltransferase (adenine-specific)